MVAVINAYAVLLYRFCSDHGAPHAGSTPWDFFPLNNPQFMELSGIDSIETGLSQPPKGHLGSSINERTRTIWKRKAQGAIDFLEFCTKERLKASKTPTIEDFQPNVFRVAPHHADWEWIVDRFFGVPGGLYDRITFIMKDTKCDAEEAYRRARDDQMLVKGDAFQEGDIPNVGKFDNVWLEARNAVGRAILGDPMRNGRIPPMYMPTLRALCYRHFERDIRSLTKNATKMKPLEEKLAKAYQAANDHPTLKSLRSASSLLGQVVKLHRMLGITGQLAETAIWRVRLDQLMEDLGRKKVKGKMVRVKPKHPKARLVADDQLDLAWAEYQQEIWSPNPSNSTPFDIEFGGEEVTSGPLPGMNDFALDAGVAHWSGKTIEDIKRMLLIPEGGLPGARVNEDGTKRMEGLSHQWVCVLEVVNRSFTKPGELGRPTLMADKVGMGKTGQSIMFIQVLWHLKALQDGNPKWPETKSSDGIQKWPEFLGDRKLFMGRKRIPALPSWIAAPTTLITQWQEALDTWLADDACHVLHYSGGDSVRKQFWETGQLYDRAIKSSHPERTIILVDMPTILSEGRINLTEKGDLKRGEPSTGHSDDFLKGFFSHESSVGILDEGHNYRNNGPNYRTVVTMMSGCVQRLVLTATPVYTSYRDLLSLGRILQAPGFIGILGEELTERVERISKITDKGWEDEGGEEKLREFLRELRDEGAKPEPSMRSLLPNIPQDLREYRPFWSTRRALFELREAMQSYIIRRDERSLDSDGNPILNLLPLINVISYLELDQATEEALSAQSGTREYRTRGRMDLDGFFTSLKKILIHPFLMRKKPKGLSQDEFTRTLFPDLASYKAHPSPKIDRILQILAHHLGDANSTAPPLSWTEDGKLIEANESSREPNPKEGPPRRRKAVIFCHLSESWLLVNHILELHGHKCLMINGNINTALRDEAVASFQSEDGPDVLLLSGVGAQGLNLQRGSIMMFADHPWSDSESQQIDGRLQRRGQKYQVISYKLIAPNTPDEYLLGYAEGKKLMMQVFTQECKTRGMPGFEWEEKEEEGEDEDEVPKTDRRQRASRATVRQRKKAASRDTTVKVPGLEEDGGRKLGRGTDGDDKSEPITLPDSDGEEPNEHTAASTLEKPSPPPSTQNPDPPAASSETAKRTVTTRRHANKSKPMQTKPRPEKFFHPDFPELGARPREGTIARDKWEKRVMKAVLRREALKRDLMSEVTSEIAAGLSANPALVQAFAQAKVTPTNPAPIGQPDPTGSDTPGSAPEDTRPTDVGTAIHPLVSVSDPKGKGKAKLDASDVDGSSSARSAKSNLLSDHTMMLQMVSMGVFTWAEAQSALNKIGKPPLPEDLNPTGVQAGGSSSRYGDSTGTTTRPRPAPSFRQSEHERATTPLPPISRHSNPPPPRKPATTPGRVAGVIRELKSPEFEQPAGTKRPRIERSSSPSGEMNIGHTPSSPRSSSPWSSSFRSPSSPHSMNLDLRPASPMQEDYPDSPKFPFTQLRTQSTQSTERIESELRNVDIEESPWSQASTVPQTQRSSYALSAFERPDPDMSKTFGRASSTESLEGGSCSSPPRRASTVDNSDSRRALGSLAGRTPYRALESTGGGRGGSEKPGETSKQGKRKKIKDLFSSAHAKATRKQ